MKILYLRLVNSAGIWAGMSKEDIEIDFTKCKNSIVMLFGGNGSGKTTILSSLNPFCGSTNDSRKNFFRKGKEGFKEIHYQVDDKIYMIRHYAKKQTKSYISVIDSETYFSYLENEIPLSEIFDYEGSNELNENGGVKTFNEIVENKLGVTEDYFKISRIGSNVNNFMDLSVAERKKYISLFLPNIEEYLAKYKVVNDKFKILSKEIKFVSDEIMKLDSEENLNEDLNNLQNQLSNYNNEISKLSQNVLLAKGKISILDKDGFLGENDYENPYEEEFNKIRKIYEKEKKSINSLDDDTTLVTIEKSITKLSSSIEILKNSVESKKKIALSYIEKKDSLNNSIESKNRQLNGIDIEDLNELKEIELKKNEELKETKNYLEHTKLEVTNFDLSKIDKDNFNSYKKIVRNFNTLVNEFLNKLTDDEKKILNNIFVSEEISYTEFVSSIDELKSEIKNINKVINENENKLSNLNSNLKQKDILNKRPDTCVDDNCPFIKNALQYKNIDKDIENTNKELERLNKQNEEYNKELELYNSVYKKCDNINYFLKNNSDDIDELVKWSNNSIKNMSSFDKIMKYILTTNISVISIELNLSSLSEYINTEREYESINNELIKIQDKIKNAEKFDIIHKNLINELNDLNTELINVRDNYVSVKKKIDNINNEISEKNDELEHLNEIKTSLSEFDTIEKNYNKLKENYENTNEILSQISELTEKIYDWRQDKNKKSLLTKPLEEKIDNIKLKISRLKEYTERKNNLDEKFNKYNLVKESLNPTKGIPVYFISDYLNKTQSITNDLLDISQNGKFAISFDIDDKNFFINVIKSNGDVLEDISDASQGEVSLTSLSLSLALMEQSMSIYNIFYLDELDGALDDNNRKSFLTMIEKQKYKLGSEQIFIISHNKEFDYFPIDMILLNDNSIEVSNKEFMSNKNIIFSV